jgi:predicted house-cleaning noncanonical NTP pyrophosphatase (MazG superfamily)
MKIRKDQLGILESLRCERLSSDRSNLYAVENFSNSINDDIALTLRNEAFKEDESNSIAYYVVKHPNDQILFFFSLKCGLLFDHFINPELLKQLQKLAEELNDISDDKSLTPQQRRDVTDVMEKIRANKGVTKDDIHKLRQQKLDILEELEKEFNTDIARVGKTFSGIELVHFCSNTEADDSWENFGFPQLRGTIIFWYFVVPMVMEAIKYVGSQYLFLFAADRSKDEKLVRYYEDQLNFTRPDELATAKPFYDFTCRFMCHDISSLEIERKDFFDNFNPDTESV